MQKNEWIEIPNLSGNKFQDILSPFDYFTWVDEAIIVRGANGKTVRIDDVSRSDFVSLRKSAYNRESVVMANILASIIMKGSRKIISDNSKNESSSYCLPSYPDSIEFDCPTCVPNISSDGKVVDTSSLNDLELKNLYNQEYHEKLKEKYSSRIEIKLKCETCSSFYPIIHLNCTNCNEMNIVIVIGRENNYKLRCLGCESEFHLNKYNRQLNVGVFEER